MALSVQLPKIQQGLENFRLLPMIIGNVPQPAIGEILPTKDILHPKVFGFGLKRIMCEAYDISLLNHDYNVVKKIVSVLIENIMNIALNLLMTKMPKTLVRLMLRQLTRS